MKTTRYGFAIAITGVILALAACSPSAPVLPPSVGLPDGSPKPTVAPVPVETATEDEPVAPSTAVIPASGIETNGLPQYPVLEEQALVYTGIMQSPNPVTDEQMGSTLTPVQKVEAAGGAAPTADYVLNLSYKMCTTVQAYHDEGLDMATALTKATAEVPGWVGFTSPGAVPLATAYLDVAMTSYSYICVPLFDERARADLELGVYQG